MTPTWKTLPAPTADDVGAVPADAAIALDTQDWVIERTFENGSRPVGERTGFFVMHASHEGDAGETTDPLVGMGTSGPVGTFALQVEADWDTTAGPGPHIAEMYLQVIKQPGDVSRRPMYVKWDKDMGRAATWQFMVGKGKDDTGASPGAFQIRWDDDTSPVGANMFSVEPNRLNLYPVQTGGVAADQTRMRLYSAAGQGSGFSLTFNAADADGTAEPTLVMQSEGATWAGIWSKGSRIGYWNKPGAAKAGLELQCGLRLGDNTALWSAAWSCTGVPSNALGSDGDVMIRQDGTFAAGTKLYEKIGGAWVAMPA